MRVKRGENFLYFQIIPHYIEFCSKLMHPNMLAMSFKLTQGLVSMRLLTVYTKLSEENHHYYGLPIIF